MVDRCIGWRDLREIGWRGCHRGKLEPNAIVCQDRNRWFNRFHLPVISLVLSEVEGLSPAELQARLNEARRVMSGSAVITGFTSDAPTVDLDLVRRRLTSLYVVLLGHIALIVERVDREDADAPAQTSTST